MKSTWKNGQLRLKSCSCKDEKVISQIRNQLVQVIDEPLVDQLLRAHSELKNNYYLGKHKTSELEGGHFAEVVIRVLQFLTAGS